VHEIWPFVISGSIAWCVDTCYSMCLAFAPWKMDELIEVLFGVETFVPTFLPHLI